MEKQIVSNDGLLLMGIKVRTNNQDETSGKGKIAQTIGRYFADGIADKLPNRMSPGVMHSVYTEYEDEDRGEYTYFVGEAVASLDEVPEGVATLRVPAQRYAKFTLGPGVMPDACVQAWQAIWQMTPEMLGGARAFVTDFEIYDQRAQDPQKAVFDIYIGLQ